MLPLLEWCPENVTRLDNEWIRILICKEKDRPIFVYIHSWNMSVEEEEEEEEGEEEEEDREANLGEFGCWKRGG